MKKMFMVLPVLILAIGAGLVMTGVINVPGISPSKGKKKAAANYASDKDGKAATGTKGGKVADAKKPVNKKSTTPPPTSTNKTTTPPKVDATVAVKNPEMGVKKLAKLWNEMEPAALKDITKDWKDKDLAAILVKMDTAKVAEFLGILDSKRASSLSHELQNQASIVPAATGS